MNRWPLIFLLLMLGCAKEFPAEPQVLRLGEPCDAATKPCGALGPDESLVLSLATPQPLRPFTMSAKWQGAPAESVSVNFEMAGMDMGENRYRLLPDAQGNWFGKAVLPVCVAGRSDWVAEVLVNTRSGSAYRARFPFIVIR